MQVERVQSVCYDGGMYAAVSVELIDLLCAHVNMSVTGSQKR